MDSSLRKSVFSIKGITGLRNIIIFVFSVFSVFVASANVVPQGASCSAPDDYLKDLARFANSIKVEQDYSCLVDLSSINTRLNQYQLVDIQAKNAVDNAWKISLNELRLKSYLNNRRLLLLGDNFSRVKAAASCAVLKQSNFANIKILVGGVATWHQYKENKPFNPESRMVTAKDFMYEYFNGSVVVVVTNEDARNKLRVLGIDKATISQSNDVLEDLIIDKSLQGFLPVVVIGDVSGTDSLLKRYSNLFLLEGGIAALETQFKNDVFTELSRFDTLGSTSCETL